MKIFIDCYLRQCFPHAYCLTAPSRLSLLLYPSVTSHFCVIFGIFLRFREVFPLLQATELESLVICLPLFNGSCSYSKLPLLLAGKTHWKTRSDSPKAPRSQLFHHRCSSRDPQHGPRQQTLCWLLVHVYHQRTSLKQRSKSWPWETAPFMGWWVFIWEHWGW